MQIDISGLSGLRAEHGLRPRARARINPKIAWAGPLFAFEVNTARIDLIGDIDPFDGISAAMVIGKLDQMDVPEITVRIHSCGGDVFDGVAIHNALANHPARIIVKIDAVAASVASWIAMAADEIIISEGAMMMIHNSWQLLAGDANMLEAAAKVLRKIDDAMGGAYARRTGQSDAKIRAMMDSETWLTAEEAVAGGFADRILAVGATSTSLAARAEIEKPRPASGVNVSPEFLARLQGVAAAMFPNGD